MATNNAVDVGLNGSTGSGNFVGATSPILITPTIGAATATTITFNPTTGGIVGTTTNNNTNAGNVGEFVESVITSPVSISNNAPTDITSISLTAGDWDVYGNITFEAALGTPIISSYSWISETSATLPALYLIAGLDSPSGSTTRNLVTPYKRISIASTTTVYLSGYVTFGSSTVGMTGAIYARRAR